MIRELKSTDCGSIARIYNKYILNSTATFETEAVSEEEMSCRLSAIAARYPCFVCEEEGMVVGYCYAHEWKGRAAYSKTLETTIYLSSEYQGRGIGSELMQRLIKECRNRGYHALIACITAENRNSRLFHEKLGFRQVSFFERVGEKFGHFLDVTDYELLLLEK